MPDLIKAIIAICITIVVLIVAAGVATGLACAVKNYVVAFLTNVSLVNKSRTGR
jgi:hypothetical protein